ncbi:MAG: hypothetical protein EZS28_047124, partial [Streblomastix strix]
QIIASMNLNLIPDMLCLTMIYLAINATSNFEELNPITGTSQCYGIVSSSYLFFKIIFQLLQYVNVPYNVWPPLNPLPLWSIYRISRLIMCFFNDGIVRPPPAPACGSLNT